MATKYVYKPARDEELMRLSKVELKDKGTKAAKDELARRTANKAAKKAALKAAS